MSTLNQKTTFASFADILEVVDFLKLEYPYCELVEIQVAEIEDNIESVFITINLSTSSRTSENQTYRLLANDLANGNWDTFNLEEFEDNYLWYQV